MKCVVVMLVMLNTCVGYPRLQFDGGGENQRLYRCCNDNSSGAPPVVAITTDLQDLPGDRQRPGRVRRSIIGNSEVAYLTQFGYLPQSILETGALTSQQQLSNAIR